MILYPARPIGVKANGELGPGVRVLCYNTSAAAAGGRTPKDPVSLARELP